MSRKVQFSSIWTIDRFYHSGSEWTGQWWQWKSIPHSSKLQHYWNLTIRLFSVISRTLVAGVLPFCREAVGVFYSPSQLDNNAERRTLNLSSSTDMCFPSYLHWRTLQQMCYFSLSIKWLVTLRLSILIFLYLWQWLAN